MEHTFLIGHTSEVLLLSGEPWRPHRWPVYVPSTVVVLPQKPLPRGIIKTGSFSWVSFPFSYPFPFLLPNPGKLLAQFRLRASSLVIRWLL
jgi:hypothetical protein